MPFLEALAKAKANLGQGTKETNLRVQIQHKAQCQDNRVIQYCNEKIRSGSVHHVIAPNVEGEWVLMMRKKDIEQALLEENERRFNQAADTPFMVPPLSDKVDGLGIGLGAQQILNGSFAIPEGTDPIAAKLIPHLQ